MNILVIHGPNLNMLGKRDAKHYGTFTLDDLYAEIADYFVDDEFSFFQSNHEGELIDVIQHAEEENYDALLINPGAYTHTSIAIRDALELIYMPKVEVHLSDIENREDFRKIDYIKDVCHERFMGKKIDSYIEAIQFIKNLVLSK
ncbi:MAG: 3-dehydroquinate dehydratase [Acholeplasmataceae bacterium]|nr:3-dehydroquinate dehydratase [Acholeplasmataceae bacterium]